MKKKGNIYTDSIVLDELAFKPDCDQMIKRMHLREGRPETDRFREMVVEAQKLAKPRLSTRSVKYSLEDRPELSSIARNWKAAYSGSILISSTGLFHLL